MENNTVLGGTASTLIFGPGTSLSVEPEDQTHVQPSVFVLRSDDAVACLVKDFYPKQAEIFMNSSSGSETGIETSSPVMSKSGKYSAVHVKEFPVPDHVTCAVGHGGSVVMSNDVMETQKENPSVDADRSKSTEECEAPTDQLIVRSSEKVNMLSMTVMSLRVLFAKSLAFNLLLSATFFLL